MLLERILKRLIRQLTYLFLVTPFVLFSLFLIFLIFNIYFLKFYLVFGSEEGPGGVIVCCENFLIYKNKETELKCPLPRRHELPKDKGIMIVNFTSYKKKDFFYFIVQSEFGDLYKVSLEYTSDIVHGVIVQYFDTIPVCVSLNCLGGAFLFAPADISNQ